MYYVSWILYWMRFIKIKNTEKQKSVCVCVCVCVCLRSVCEFAFPAYLWFVSQLRNDQEETVIKIHVVQIERS